MSFLTDYRTYTACKEGHPTYQMWAGLVALSSVIGRRVWVEQGDHRVLCQLYVTLVGPPGNRKTSQKDVALRLIREIGVTHFSAEAQSKESLCLQMTDKSQDSKSTEAYLVGPSKWEEGTPICLFLTELKEFIGLGGAHLIDFLTTIYDRNDFYDWKTVKHGDRIIVNPFITMLACETPEWIINKLRQDVISGGFARRNLFIVEEEYPVRIARPVITQEAKDAWKRMVAHGKAIRNMEGGAFKWEPGAAQFYDEWYNTRPIPKDEPLSKGYYETKGDLVLKLAMLVSMSEDLSKSLKIIDIKTAMDILEMTVEKNMTKLWRGMGTNPLNAVLDKALTLLEQAGGPIPEKKLRAILFGMTDERGIDQVITNLDRTGKVFAWQDSALRTLLCHKDFLPPAVVQAIARAAEKASGLTGVIDLPPAPQSSPSGTSAQPPAVPPSSPSTSAGSTEPPQMV